MPLISYSCKCGETIKKFFREAAKAPPVFTCKKCSKEAKKCLSSPTIASKITVDNGVQPRAVEILPNITELMEERSSKDYRKGD